MKKVILSMMVIAVVVIACNSNGDKTKESTPTEAITADTITKKEKEKPIAEQLYSCSMHPEVIGKKDDKCPKCGMKLTEPVKNRETPK
jgi:hypothetical protein